MGEAIGIHAAAPLWHALMEHLLRERRDPPVPDPTLGSTLVRREVCPLTGLVPAPGAGGPAGVSELFLEGTEPAESAAGRFVADAAGGPAHLRLPAEYAAWCRSPQNTLGAVAPPAGGRGDAAGGNGPGITIICPPENAHYTLDAELPARQQMLELTANTAGAEPVRWTVGGQPVEPEPDGRVFWPLARGTWSVEASVPGAQAAPRQIVVE